MQFNKLHQFYDHFKDDATCLRYYEQLRWNGNVICPKCGKDHAWKTKAGWKCSNRKCMRNFTAKVGTVMENSKIPFRYWFITIFMVTTRKKGISSRQLAEDLEITVKSAWFLIHRVREMMRDKSPVMLGTDKAVEVDETFFYGKEKNKHWEKKLHNRPIWEQYPGSGIKKVVVGAIERDGKVIVTHIPQATKEYIAPFLEKNVIKRSCLYTDQAGSYGDAFKSYFHYSINHSAKIYVVGHIHTNTIESFWAALKRGINGTFHHVSDKHMQRYLDEFASRFNTRHMNRTDRFNFFLSTAQGRLVYKKLIAAR